MNPKNLSKIVKNCWNEDHILELESKKTIDGENKLIPRKIKDDIHSLKNPNLNKVCYMLSEIWLPNLW